MKIINGFKDRPGGSWETELFSFRPEFNLERRCAMKKKVIAGTIVVSLLAALIILKKKGEM